MKLRNLVGTAVAIALSFGFAGTAEAQSFEGTISFKKSVGPITANYTYHVKGDKVRIEEIDEDGNVQGIMLVNTSENEVLALSPERKMFIEVPNKRPNRKTDLSIEETKNTKNILGLECKEWKVISAEDNREISYWLADNNFDFFVPMLKTLNRKDKLAVFFLKLPNQTGAFPLLGVESQEDGTELTKLEVKEVNESVLSDELFAIPNGYTKFEREARN